jgi:hypothetical protein
VSDQSPRSAFEIAMERLRRQDAEEGIERRLPTDQERAAIAEIRNFYGAKLAQEEVMHAAALRQTLDSAKREELDDAYRRDCERLISERDAKIERARRGEGKA